MKKLLPLLLLSATCCYADKPEDLDFRLFKIETSIEKILDRLSSAYHDEINNGLKFMIVYELEQCLINISKIHEQE